LTFHAGDAASPAVRIARSIALGLVQCVPTRNGSREAGLVDDASDDARALRSRDSRAIVSARAVECRGGDGADVASATSCDARVRLTGRTSPSC